MQTGGDAESAPLLSQHLLHGLHPPPHALLGDGGVPAEVVPMHRGFRLVHSDLGALAPQPLGVEQRFIVEAVKLRRLYVNRGNGRT